MIRTPPELYLETHVVERPSVVQLRCATQIVQRIGKSTYMLTFSSDVAKHVLRRELPPYQATIIG